MDLKGKSAIVTGGSSGIGRAITLALVNVGASVVFTYNSKEKEAQEIVEMAKGAAFCVKVDFKNAKDIEKLFDFSKDKFEKLDILVNNAGVNRPRGLFDVSDWREIFDVDLFPVVDCTGRAVEMMKNDGRILNITSIYGEAKACYKGIAPYGAAKAALNHYTVMLAKNLSPGILVNALAPGYVRTPLWKNTTEEEFEENGREQLIERMIKPEEIAEMAVSILKNDAIAGEIVIVDGGLSLKTI